MTEAWMVRSGDQQQFIERLHRGVQDEAEESTRYTFFLLGFGIKLLNELSSLLAKEGIPKEELPTIVQRIDQLMVRLRPEITQFARVPSEEPYLLWRLFEALSNSIAARSSGDYQREQMENPQAVFGAPSAMAEIDLAGRSFED